MYREHLIKVFIKGCLSLFKTHIGPRGNWEIRAKSTYPRKSGKNVFFQTQIGSLMCFLRPGKHKDGGVSSCAGGGVWWLLPLTTHLLPICGSPHPLPQRCWWDQPSHSLSGPQCLCWLSFSLPISPLSVKFSLRWVLSPPPHISFTPLGINSVLSALVVFPLRSPVSVKDKSVPAPPLCPCLFCLL